MDPCQLAELGYQILPCTPGAKRPHPKLAPNGVYSASSKAADVARWLKLRTNLAIHCSHMAVIDIDPAGIPWLEQHHHLLQLAGAVVSTPRGGKHLWFAAPPHHTIQNSINQIAPGVDLKTTGGYVLVPPSAVNGKNYTWISSPTTPPDRLPPIPSQLLAPKHKPKPPTKTKNVAITHHGPIATGTRNCTLASIAGKLRRIGLVNEELYHALAEINQQFCHPPLDDREVARIAKSISRYPA